MAYGIAQHRTTPRSRGLLVGGLIAILATLGGGPAGRPADVFAADPHPATASSAPADDTGPITLGDTVTFYGRGYGHGVGMSQYGARGRALAGQDAATILAHYYEGATLATIPAGAHIRVLVLDKWPATHTKPLVIYGRRAAWRIDGVDKTFPIDAKLRVIPTTTKTATGTRTSWRIRVNAPGGAILYDGVKPADLVIRGVNGNTRLQAWSKPGSFDQYRGTLRVIAKSATANVTVVNDVPLERYLGGVVPVEMPSVWPTEALQAQTIAARSYAARRLRPGVSYYDVPDDTRSQVYRGVLAEKATTNNVIKATTGQVLKSGSTIADTLFHSTGGGATEDNENVFTSASGAKVAGPLSYLRGSLDRDDAGIAYDAAAPYATWTTDTYSIADVSTWFATDPRTDVGTLTALDLGDRGVSGRLISVTLIGTDGTRTVSGEVFRSVFNARRPSGDPMLRSTLFATAPIP